MERTPGDRGAADRRRSDPPGSRRRLVVLEYFTAGGRLPDRDPWPMRGEGASMLRALLADLADLGLPELAVVLRPGFPSPLPDGVERLTGGDPAAALARALEGRRGWVWIVGPETRGILEGLLRTAGRAGAATVGTPPAGVRRAGHRLALLRRLDRAGLPVPGTLPAPTPAAARRALDRLGPPVVVKPGRGAGGAGTRRVEARRQVGEAWEEAVTAEPGLAPLVQRFVPGTPASATLLADGDGVTPLALNGQRVRFTPRARYRGGSTPLRHPDAARALRTAGSAARACGRLRGLVGVDLVLGPDGPVVLEVNPRLTTSYLGLRERFGPAPAGAALRASGCPLGEAPPVPSAPDPSADVARGEAR